MPIWLSQNFALLAPIQQQVAEWNLAGKLQTAVEQKGMPRQRIHFGDVDALVAFGFPQHDGEMPPGTTDLQGRALVAQTGPMEFVVTGFDASVTFVKPEPASTSTPNQTQIEILQADEGTYVNGTWQTSRIWNGDQTDRGLNFRGTTPSIIRIRLHEIPLFESSIK